MDIRNIEMSTAPLSTLPVESVERGARNVTKLGWAANAIAMAMTLAGKAMRRKTILLAPSVPKAACLAASPVLATVANASRIIHG